MSLGVNRNTPTQPIQGKQPAKAAGAAQAAGTYNGTVTLTAAYQ